MGSYFNGILYKTNLNGNSRVWIYILLEVFFAIFAAIVVEILKKIMGPVNDKLRKKSLKRDVYSYCGRDAAVDVAKGIFIISMLVGHFTINNMLRRVIYSCHMTAFIFFSGYFYKKSCNLWETVKHVMRNVLFPYVIFVAGVIVINYNNLNIAYIKEVFIKYLIGMSFSKKVFSEVSSVGPVYFILMLFIIRLTYLVVDYVIKNERYKWLVIACISIFGMVLGEKGFWLPWSIDIACYAMVFYQLGVYFRKYDLLSKVKSSHILYFILTPIWVYMIYSGSMELAVRNYGQYGLVIIGSAAGVLSIYQLSSYISDKMPVLKEVLRMAGESSMLVLMIHTLIGSEIGTVVSCRFDSRYIPYLICTVVLQIVLSWLVKKALGAFRLTI